MAWKDESGNKVSAGLLRRSLASAAGAADPCPDPEILAAYSERALDASETAHYESHFSQCARCREQLAMMVRAAAPAAQAAENARVRRFRWVWPWTWFVLTPVTAALLFAAVFIARRPAASRALEQQQPLVAMQPPSQPPMQSAVPESVPEDRLREAPPAKPAPPAGAASAGAMQRIAPPDFTADLKAEPEQPAAPPTPEKKDLSRRSISDLAVQSRNYIELNKPANAPAAQTPGGGVQSDDTEHVRSQSQSVTVESAAAPVTTAPAPQTLTADSAVGGEMPAGNSGGAPAAPRAKGQVPAAASANRSFAASEMVVVEAPLDRDARTLVRSPDPRILWRISSGRFVERSEDAGATWRAQWTSANAHVVAGSAPSVDTCWLVGRGGIVLLTADGKKWRAIEPPADADFVNVAASDASSAEITATDGRKFETSDGGKHWIPAP